jgi:hypothetical protein
MSIFGNSYINLPLQSPAYSQVTFLAYDESTGTYNVNVPGYQKVQAIIDGSSIQSSGSSFNLLNGPHTVEVPYPGALDYLEVDGVPVSNPATITFSHDTTITAHYYYLPMVTLTVEAYGFSPNNYYTLHSSVYLDNEYAGFTPMATTVIQRWYQVDLDPWVWEYGYGFQRTNVWYFDGSDWYESYYGGVPIYSDTDILGYYVLRYD